MPTDPIPHSPHSRGFGSPERSLGPDGNPTPPRAGPLQRLRGGPKDTIPIVGKAPRKQRSSRFYVSDKVEIEKLPSFSGALPAHRTYAVIQADDSQRSDQRSVMTFLSGNCNSARSSLISMTLVQSYRANKSRRRLCTRCSSTLHKPEGSSRSRYIQRSSTWWVCLPSSVICRVRGADKNLSLPPISSDRFRPRSTQQATHLTQRRTSLCSSWLGRIYKSCTNSSFASSRVPISTPISENALLIRVSCCR